MNQQEAQQLLDDVSSLKGDVSTLKDDVAEIKKAVIGDTKWGRKGLIEKVEDLEAWQQKVILKVAFWSGAASAVVVIVSHLWDYYIYKSK